MRRRQPCNHEAGCPHEHEQDRSRGNQGAGGGRMLDHAAICPDFAAWRDGKSGSRHVRSAEASGTVPRRRPAAKPGKDGKAAGGISPDFVKGLATGGVAGGLAGILLGGKTSKKLAKGAVKLGGTAALAGLAYKAYKTGRPRRQAPAAEAPPPMKDITPRPEGTRLPARRAAQQRDGMSLAILRAMIAAAKADGHIDAEEHSRFSPSSTSSISTPRRRPSSSTNCASPSTSTRWSRRRRRRNWRSRSMPRRSSPSTPTIRPSRPISPCWPRASNSIPA